MGFILRNPLVNDGPTGGAVDQGFRQFLVRRHLGVLPFALCPLTIASTPTVTSKHPQNRMVTISAPVMARFDACGTRGP
jgi:hypothetical protein